MAKFRKKPVVIEATQWNRLGDHPAVVPVPSNHPAWDQPQQAQRCGWIDGQFVHPGHWIVEGDERRVVDDFTFTAKYEPHANALPDIEAVSAKVHEAWMESKKAQGVGSRLSEKGEELMVPYEQLSEEAQELDRGTVRAVYAAIQAADGAKGSTYPLINDQ